MLDLKSRKMKFRKPQNSRPNVWAGQTEQQSHGGIPTDPGGAKGQDDEGIGQDGQQGQAQEHRDHKLVHLQFESQIGHSNQDFGRNPLLNVIIVGNGFFLI